MHDCDQDGLRGKRLLNICGIKPSVFIYRQPGNPESSIFKVMTYLRYSRMFNNSGNDVVSLYTVCISNPLDRKIIGLGSPAGENDFVTPRIQQVRNLLPGLFNGSL